MTDLNNGTPKRRLSPMQFIIGAFEEEAHRLAGSLHCFSDSHLPKHKVLPFNKFAISPVDPLMNNDPSDNKTEASFSILSYSVTLQFKRVIRSPFHWLASDTERGDKMRVSKILFSIPEIQSVPHFSKKYDPTLVLNATAQRPVGYCCFTQNTLTCITFNIAS